MNLRKRNVTVDTTKKPEVKKRKKPLRRSERNKVSSKDKSENLKTCNDTIKAGPRPRSRRKRLGWSRKKKPCTVEEYPSALLFPPVIETGFNDIIQEMVDASPEDLLLTREAELIYECRACNSFFREFTVYLKHKRLYCTTLAHKSKKSRDDWNSVLNKLGFDLGSDESNASDSDVYDDEPDIKIEAPDSEIECSEPDLSEEMVEEDKATIETSLRNLIEESRPPEHQNVLVEPHCSEVLSRTIKVEPTSPEHTEENSGVELESFLTPKIEPFDESSIFNEEYPNTFIKTENQEPSLMGSNEKVAKPASSKRRSVIVEEDNICQFCSEIFSKASDLRYHKRSEHYGQVLTYTCLICYANFLSIPKLQRHISKTHHVEPSSVGFRTEVMNLGDPRLT